MPVRLLREGILDSDAVCSMSFPAEVFYRRLMSVVDDFGRFDGRVSVLRSRLYALQIDKVREADITRWVAECAKAGLIALYSVSGKPYILLHKLGEPRAKESKYPDPPPGLADANSRDRLRADESSRLQTQTSESSRAQTHADVPPSSSPSDASSDTPSVRPPYPRRGGGSGEHPQFAEFWEAYPRKVARPKAAAAFAKVDPSSEVLAVMLAAIQRHKASYDWQKDGGQYIPHPATWLNQRRWEDATQPTSKPPPRTKADRDQEQLEREFEACHSHLFPGGPE